VVWRNFRTCCWSSSNLSPPRNSFSGPNGWKLLAAKSGLYGGCGSSSRTIIATFSTVWRALCGAALSCCNMTPFRNKLGRFRWMAGRVTGLRVVYCSIVCIHCRSIRHKVDKNNALTIPKHTAMLTAVTAKCGAPARSSSTDWRPLRKLAHHLKHSWIGDCQQTTMNFCTWNAFRD